MTFLITRSLSLTRLQLLNIDPASPALFDNAKDLTGYFADLPLGRTHNVIINEELDYGVAVGAAPRVGGCFGGLIFFDLQDSSKPTSMGCFSKDNYTHDVSLESFVLKITTDFTQAQCMVYRGPDTKYHGRDICYGYNEDTLTM